MGVSEVLLCPYRCLEYKMERLCVSVYFSSVYFSVVFQLLLFHNNTEYVVGRLTLLTTNIASSFDRFLCTVLHIADDLE